MAAIFGLTPAPPEACRVLELGCGDGGNLIPQGAALPGSRFVGIDLAPSAIARGQALLASLGLNNVELRHEDVAHPHPDLGVFDYVIAHGLYSWVPERVREAILALCKSHLNPQGVAYVSYNTYPGCYIRRMLREMMLYHIRNFPSPERKIEQARAVLEFISEGRPDAADYASLVRNELSRLREYSSEALYHDDLSEANEPVFFFQFMEHAASHGLQYLADADFYEMHDYGLLPPVAEKLRQLSKDIVMREQYMDFIKGRYFRRTLLCHAGLRLDRVLRPEMRRFAFASSVRPVAAEPDLNSRRAEEFRDALGRSLRTEHPLAKAAFLCLGEAWPRALYFGELADAARARLSVRPSPDGASAAGEESALGEVLLKTYAANLVEVHSHRPQFVTEVSERPVASRLARLQAAGGELVTTQRHTNIQVEDPFTRSLIVLLDGTRTKADLGLELVRQIELGNLRIEKNGPPHGNAADMAEEVLRLLEAKLRMLANFGVLIA